MTNPFGPAAQPQAAPANPFGPAAAPAPQAAPPAFAPPAQVAPEAYGTPGQPGSSQWPAGAQPAAAPTLASSFSKPAPVTSGGGQGADLKAMYGRLVLVIPIKIERGIPSNFKSATGEAQLQDRMTATFIVLDGGSPIAFGGDMYAMPQKPHDKSEPLPHVSKGLWVSQSKLIEACEPALRVAATSGPGSTSEALVLGRLLKNGTDKNSAWILGEYTPQDQQIAEYYLSGVKSGQFVNPLA
jgi:hypothetical protein